MALLLIGVAITSFSLGRLSARDAQRPPVTLESVFPESGGGGSAIGSVAGASLVTENVGQTQGEVVGSINGSKYHYPWCSGAQRIKDENKIWFATIADAKKAGYTPAANCQGLE